MMKGIVSQTEFHKIYISVPCYEYLNYNFEGTFNGVNFGTCLDGMARRLSEISCGRISKKMIQRTCSGPPS